LLALGIARASRALRGEYIQDRLENLERSRGIQVGCTVLDGLWTGVAGEKIERDVEAMGLFSPDMLRATLKDALERRIEGAVRTIDKKAAGGVRGMRLWESGSKEDWPIGPWAALNAPSLLGLLKELGVDLWEKTPGGQDALDLKAWDADEKTVADLLAALPEAERHERLNREPEERGVARPLARAAMAGSAGGVRQLLAAGADPALADAEGQAALALCAKSAPENEAGLECLEALLGAGADPNAKDLAGETALVAAVKRRRSKIVAVLARKTDVFARDPLGKNAIDHAFEGIANAREMDNEDVARAHATLEALSTELSEEEAEEVVRRFAREALPRISRMAEAGALRRAAASGERKAGSEDQMTKNGGSAAKNSSALSGRGRL
jgi:hypothetical protein